MKRQHSIIEKPFAKTFKSSGLPLFFKRLLSFWDMHEYSTSLLVHVFARLDFVKEHAVFFKTKKLDWPWANRQRCQSELSDALPWLETLGLTTTRGFFDGFAREVLTMDIEGARHKADAIREVLKVELEGRKFFVLNQDNLRYYNNTQLAGEQFKDNWPKANAELIEAGNCLAFERHTACVCHVMRALEFVFQALENKLLIYQSAGASFKSLTN
jgi:hypothetical protein